MSDSEITAMRVEIARLRLELANTTAWFIDDMDMQNAHEPDPSAPPADTRPVMPARALRRQHAPGPPVWGRS